MKTEIMEVCNQEMKKKEEKNKGFSLVELIVVIAIMAILAIVIAPQVMRYIGKSKDSVDASNIALYKTAATTALSNEDIYAEVVGKGTVTIVVNSSGVTYSPVSTDVPLFVAEFSNILDSKFPAPQSPTNKKFTITIPVSAGKLGTITVVAAP